MRGYGQRWRRVDEAGNHIVLTCSSRPPKHGVLPSFIEVVFEVWPISFRLQAFLRDLGLPPARSFACDDATLECRAE